MGTADYLYRVFPFTLAIVDIDGNIVYHSLNGQADFDNPNLTAVIGAILNELLENDGRVTAKMIAKYRADRVGKRAAGLWLPRVDYFNIPKPAGKDEPTVTIPDARGNDIKVPRGVSAELKRKRNQVVRLYTRDMPAPKKPVVLVFVNGKPLAGAAKLQAWYARDRARADFYLVFADDSAEMPKRAQAAKAFLKSAKLTLPCLLDNPENDVTFAYGGQAPRLVVIDKNAEGAPVVKFISAPGADGFTRGLAEGEKRLKNRSQ